MDLNGELDFEHRHLCRDGACLGVVGPDGRCSACGLSARAPASEPEPASGDSAESPELADRALCSDGSCIGLLGPDGRCKMCGAAA